MVFLALISSDCFTAKRGLSTESKNVVGVGKTFLNCTGILCPARIVKGPWGLGGWQCPIRGKMYSPRLLKIQIYFLVPSKRCKSHTNNTNTILILLGRQSLAWLEFTWRHRQSSFRVSKLRGFKCYFYSDLGAAHSATSCWLGVLLHVEVCIIRLTGVVYLCLAVVNEPCLEDLAVPQPRLEY